MKKLNYAFYTLLAIVVFSIVVLTNNSSSDTLKLIAYILLGIVAIVLITIFVGAKVIINQNNSLFNYIVDEKYEELISIVDNKLNHLLIKTRANYLYYLKIVALISLQKETEGYELIDKVNNKDNFPVLFYYKAIIDFNNQKYDNLEDYLVSFKGSTRYITNQDFYRDYVKLLTALVLYKTDRKKASETLREASLDKFKMPCSIKAIETINSTL